MISALWKASSDGDLENVLGLLKEAPSVDIEIKDHTGVTPLIEAVKNGHVEVVRVLLDKGADPTSASSQGRPEQYTTDPAILALLHLAQSKMPSAGVPEQVASYAPDINEDPSKRYYAPPPAPYGYYPSMPPQVPEGAISFYSPSQPTGDHNGGPGNVPPPEVARYIPCRYFPSCRYGSSCLFAHPQGPYYQGPVPPSAQYPPPYDPMAYGPTYYHVPPPPSFQSPNGIPSHMGPMSPQQASHHTPPPPPMTHARSGSELLSPVQVPFSPSGGPHVPYGAMSPISPSYGHPGHIPVPISLPPLPPLHQQPPPAGPQSPQALYNNSHHSAPPSASAFPVRQDTAAPYPPAPQGTYADSNVDSKPPPVHPQADGFGSSAPYRDGMSHHRRGSVRRTSFIGGRKPPCAFFPFGRCRNGDDCRFPHIMPDGPGSHHPPNGRNGFRTRGPPNGNSLGTIEQKMSNMTVREDAVAPRQNGTESSSRSQSTDAGSHSRYNQNYKSGPNGNGHGNGPRTDKRTSVAKQRVPNADDFPVLAGSTTPPLRSPGTNGSLTNGHGPTAAQVLQAPAPSRRDSTKDSTPRDVTPDLPQVAPAKELKGNDEVAVNASESSYDHINQLSVSFATIATGAPNAGKAVSVSA